MDIVMTNKQLLEKLKEDMELRGFSKHTKAKEITEYFGKQMRQVKIQELREYLLKYLREERGLTEKSANYYNHVIRFIYDVVIDVQKIWFGTSIYFWTVKFRLNAVDWIVSILN